MEDDTEKLLRKLVLTDVEEKVIRVDPEHTSVNEVREKCCLVGKTLVRRSMNVEVMRNTLAR
ncbi:hypothetical protein U1Q18_036260, partial [Sarracenia purpurea var. burkii]